MTNRPMSDLLPRPVPDGRTLEVHVSSAHHASNCRWAIPTVFLPRPYWLLAETSPWTCVRHTPPLALVTTERCADCERWQLMSMHEATPDSSKAQATCK
jgi:hypothetical protein